MSEYIYGTDGHEGHWLTGEEIVRCRDCKRAFIGDARPDIGEPVLCHRTGWQVRPDGFCAWGVRVDA